MKKEIYFIILVFSLFVSCKPDVKVISPDGKQKFKTNYVGNAIIKKITIEGDRYCNFLVTTEDINKNKIQFRTYDLIFNIDDTVHISNNFVRRINDHSTNIQIFRFSH